ncbi:MAG: TIGR03435 family protein [Terracidiphilus sp.]
MRTLTDAGKPLCVRKLLLGMACFAAAFALPFFGAICTTPAWAQAATTTGAQDIAGTWQGTLHIAAANRDLRIVNKIAKGDGGALKVVDYSIDQGGQGLTADKATFEGGVLKYSIDLIRGSYEGKMSPDGKTITGTWTQGDNSLALNFERANQDTAWPIPEPEKPMAADANPSFDVATIKPSDPNRRGGKGFTFRGRHFMTFNTNMNDLIAFAYGLDDKQIIGAPDWFGKDLYDVDAVPDVEGRPNQKQTRTMVQKLLADRFKLAFHRDKKELSVYVISVASGGPKMAKSTAAPNDPPAFFFRALGDLTVRNQTMADFAMWMQNGVMDRPVVDQTGLTDRYDFKLLWTPDESQFAQFRGVGAIVPPPTDDAKAPPSLYTAIQEQLGLKMAPGKAPDDVIVIDHVEQPSPN